MRCWSANGHDSFWNMADKASFMANDRNGYVAGLCLRRVLEARPNIGR